MTFTSPALPEPRASLGSPAVDDGELTGSHGKAARIALTFRLGIGGDTGAEIRIGFGAVDRQRAGNVDRYATGISGTEGAARDLTVGDDPGPGIDGDIAGAAGASQTGVVGGNPGQLCCRGPVDGQCPGDLDRYIAGIAGAECAAGDLAVGDDRQNRRP